MFSDDDSKYISIDELYTQFGYMSSKRLNIIIYNIIQ